MGECIVKRCRATETNSEFMGYLGKRVCIKHWNDHCNGIIDLKMILGLQNQRITEPENSTEVDEMAEKKSVKKEKQGKGRKDMTVAETKYGVCVVLRLPDCQKLGFKGSEKSKEVIAFVRSKLGLPARKEKK